MFTITVDEFGESEKVLHIECYMSMEMAYKEIRKSFLFNSGVGPVCGFEGGGQNKDISKILGGLEKFPRSDIHQSPIHTP